MSPCSIRGQRIQVAWNEGTIWPYGVPAGVAGTVEARGKRIDNKINGERRRGAVLRKPKGAERRRYAGKIGLDDRGAG